MNTLNEEFNSNAEQHDRRENFVPRGKEVVSSKVVRPKSFGTFSVSVGTVACNAKCPFCIAHMTPDTHVGVGALRLAFADFNRVISCLRKSAEFARNAKIQTVLITGKGEPTLFPDEVSLVLAEIRPYGFSIVELQTNGLELARSPEIQNFHLGKWQALGLQTIAISVAHYDPLKNAKIYTPNGEYIDLPQLIARLRGFGFSVRLSVVLSTGFIDSVQEVEKMIEFGQAHDIQQLTIRPVERPTEVRMTGVGKWVSEHYMAKETMREIEEHLLNNGTLLDVLPHGALVLDYRGQNVCLTNCLTHNPEGTEIRQVINFFRAARLGTSWEYPGAILF